MLLKDKETITKAAAGKLAKRHIHTSFDLAKMGPRRYIDYTRLFDLRYFDYSSADKQYAALKGRLMKLETRQMKSRKGEYISGYIRLDDGTNVNVMSFQNVYLYSAFATLTGMDVVVCGELSYSMEYGNFSITCIHILTKAEDFRPQFYRIYTKMSGVSEKKLKELIHDCAAEQQEMLEKEILTRDSLPDYRDCIYWLNYPQEDKDIRNAKLRILYNDLLYFSMTLQENFGGTPDSRVVFRKNGVTMDFIQSLPFSLTKDQTACLNAMLGAAHGGRRINALLQGDVGCGKTIVAACLMMCAAENGYQSVLMAPRQVLAKQHYEEIKGYAEKMGFGCVFLRSGMKAKERKEALDAIKSGRCSFIIGTHSCLAADTEYKNLGLVVTDEEHLFGAAQKEAIKEKADAGLHNISMSATPIPRTMATVLYGDNKEILSIKTKPAGRKPISTHKTQGHSDLFPFMMGQIQQGHQCYVVCPAIEDNDETGLASIEAMEKEYRGWFGRYGVRVGTVHGAMKKEDIEETIASFVANEVQILISTTVIEVGVNVPNATVMAVEQADRFGLASLHQLRGRVGRSSLQSYCFLVTDDPVNERLDTMVRTNDGFEIAEADLVQRGGGNLIGTEQSGMNRYLQEMMDYPKIYGIVKETARYCLDNGYARKLIALYREHEEAEQAG